MPVISISIIESEKQIIDGIPKTITLETNVPASIFYTLDGSDPNEYSTIYVGPIEMPTYKPSIILKVFASNGVDQSPISSETYETRFDNVRLPYSSVNIPVGVDNSSKYPFGNPPSQPDGTFTLPGDAGKTMNEADLPQYPNGFDGNGAPNAFTNMPYNSENYMIKYSTANRKGETGPGIGNLPAKVTVEQEKPDAESSNQYDKLFDPKAFVVFQDFESQAPEDRNSINRQYFSLDNKERAKDGTYFFNTGDNVPPVSASFVRSHYNPKTNKINYYYFDSWTNKWIISSQEYHQTGSYDGNLANIAVSKQNGAGFVYKWVPGIRRNLF